MRYMYDGVASLAAGIRRAVPGAAMVAGYVDGRYAWTGAHWALFPRAVRVTIAVSASTGAGDVLDVETGDATPAQCEAWIAMRKRAGLYRPTIYTSLSSVPAVRQGTGRYVLGRDYDLWVASYDGKTSDPYPGCAAKQYLSTPAYDVSVVYDDGWPHRTAPAAPKPVPTEEDDMPLILQTANPADSARVTFLLDGGKLTHIPSNADQAALTAAGVKTAPVSQAFVEKVNGGSFPAM